MLLNCFFSFSFCWYYVSFLCVELLPLSLRRSLCYIYIYSAMPSKDETVGPVIDHIPVITVFAWHRRTLWRKESFLTRLLATLELKPLNLFRRNNKYSESSIMAQLCFYLATSHGIEGLDHSSLGVLVVPHLTGLPVPSSSSPLRAPRLHRIGQMLP
jgi:hypothetical protein